MLFNNSRYVYKLKSCCLNVEENDPVYRVKARFPTVKQCTLERHFVSDKLCSNNLRSPVYAILVVINHVYYERPFTQNAFQWFLTFKTNERNPQIYWYLTDFFL